MNFFSLILGKMVDRWFSQSFKVGFSPAEMATTCQDWFLACSELPQHVRCHVWVVEMKLLQDLLQPDPREAGGQVVLPVLQVWLLSCTSCHSMSKAMYGFLRRSISMNFFSLISGKVVDRWFSQSFRVGFSPAQVATACQKLCVGG